MLETFLVFIIIIFLAVPFVVGFVINDRFKKSRGARLSRASLADEPRTESEPPPAPYSSPERAGRWVKGLFVAIVVLSAVTAVSLSFQVDLLSHIARGAGYTEAQVAANDLRQRTLGLVQLLLIPGASVAFLIWFHRVHKNLPSLGSTKLAFTPAWAVGFFFVPIFNLFRPVQAMREAWHGSDPGRWEGGASPAGPDDPAGTATPALIGWWWALFILSNMASWASTRMSLFPGERTVAMLQATSYVLILDELLSIPAAAFAILLVARLTRRQNSRAELIRQSGGLPAAAATAAVPTPAELSSQDRAGRKKIILVVVGLLALPVLLLTIYFAIMANKVGTGDGDGIALEAETYEGVDPAALGEHNPDFVVDVTEWSSDAITHGATGTVKNRSVKTYHFVMVRVSFLDRQGRIVATLNTEARGPEYYAPGEEKRFQVIGDGKLEFASAEASVVYAVESK
jgi:hypothetical protein